MEHGLWVWLLAQPDTLKAAMLTAVVGIAALLVNSIVSIAGTVVNNVVTLKKMRIDLEHDRQKTTEQLKHDRDRVELQLRHDREQKETERALTLRRDIYLGVAAHLQAGLVSIADFAALHIEYATTLAQWRKNLHFAAQVHLMGGPALVRAIAKTGDEIGAAVVAIAVPRRQLEQRRQELIRIQKWMDFNSNTAAQALQRIKDGNREGTLTQAEWERLTRVCEDENALHMQSAVEYDKVAAEIAVGQRGLFLDACALQQKIYPLLAGVVKAAREELGVPFDAAVYEEIMTASVKRLNESLAVLLPGPKPAPAPAAAAG
jgi:hypothetical protein